MGGLSAGVVGLHVGASAEETPISVLDEMPERTSVNIPSVDKPYKSTEAASAHDLPSSKMVQLSRIDSHEEAADCIISLESQLAQLLEEQERTKTELLQAKDRIEELQRQNECYRTAPNSRGHYRALRYMIDFYGASANKETSEKSKNSENERLLKEQLKRSQAEVKQLELKVRKLELRDSQHEMRLDGRGSTSSDKPAFKKRYNDDLSTTVVESITYNLPKKEWTDPETQSRCEAHDDAAIGVLRLDSMQYRAKAGHGRGDVGHFISSNHWMKQARTLSEIVNHPIEDNYAVHAEPQLLAFFVTRFLQTTNHGFADLCNPETLSELKNLGPTATITITVSQEVCKICENFRKAVNRLTKDWGYKLEIVDGRKKTDEERERYKSNIWKRPQQA